MAAETANRRFSERVREGYEAPREMVREHPLPAALTVFGLGFGVGVALGVLLGEGEPRRRYDVSRLERYSRQLIDALAEIVPDAVSRRLS